MRSALPRAVLDDPLGSVRESCRAVSASARFVKIDEAALAAFARGVVPREVRATAPLQLPEAVARDAESACGYVLALNAVNFGSGYFPELSKRPGHSGFRSIEACLIDHVERRGPFEAPWLASISAQDCARLFEQESPSGGVRELLQLFARAWNDLGGAVGSSFEAYVRSAGSSARGLIRRLLEMPLYRDLCELDVHTVAFLKRAQITASDLAGLPHAPIRYEDLSELTLFADNLVPHVLRLDGVLLFARDLVRRIDSGIRLEWSSREEIEIRAAAVHATELLALETGLQPRELDAWLWTRGSAPRYKAVPRHRARCPFY